MSERLEELLPGDCPPRLVDYLRSRLSRAVRVVLDPAAMAGEVAMTSEAIATYLDELVAAGALRREDVRLHGSCGLALRPEDLASETCPNCERELDPDQVRPRRTYVRDASRRRDVPWVMTVHGMNTTAAWQEELSWRAATSYHRSVPVYAFRYGRVEVGVLLRWRQRQLADRLAATIRRLSGEPQGSRLGRRPDVICHSFGTWLVGHALQRHPDLVVGRVIVVASILRPGFDWAGLQAKGQVEAVLNHRAGRDAVVPAAAYFIPDAGPSGHRGFDSAVPVIDRVERDYGHSDFFRADQLPRAFDEVWQPFLRTPIGELAERRPDGTSWSPPPWLLRATIPRLLVLFVLLVALLGLGIGSVAGLPDVAEWLLGVPAWVSGH